MRHPGPDYPNQLPETIIDANDTPYRTPTMPDVTQILSAIHDGDAKASNELLPLVYNELKSLAAKRMASEGPGHTLNATALVHEAYLRLVGPSGPDEDDKVKWDNRGHFFAAAAEAMRRILIESARKKSRQKRGGNYERQQFDEGKLAAASPAEEVLAVDEALQKLADKDPQKAKLVELRYFAGLTGKEAAAVLGISTTTADRYWAYARAWLHQEILK